MTAARGGHVDAARLLLERGAEVDARERWHGQTALMWAAAQGHPAMLRELHCARRRRQRALEPRGVGAPGHVRAARQMAAAGRPDAALVRRARELPRLPARAHRGRRRRQRHDAGRHQRSRHRADQRPLRRRGRAARSRNRSEPRRLHRPHGAVCGHRLQHDGEVEPPGAEGAREPFDGPRRGAHRARARRRRQRAAQAPAAVSREARSRQRRNARRRHDGVPARRESRRRARDEAAARARRGPDARARRAAASAR